MTDGRLESINLSGGGVPKLPVDEARVGVEGIDGDVQRNRKHHGGPMRAVSLYSLERIRALREEGHPIDVGTLGENLTISGLDWSRVVPGVVLDIGTTMLEITRYADPCRTIAGSFRGGDFSCVSQKQHSGWSRLYARVLRSGHVRVTETVVVRIAPTAT